MKARAAVIRDRRGRFDIEEVALDDPQHGEIVVRLASAGICRTDIEFAHFWPLPAVLGHEGAGVVERVGPGVTNVAPGDHVVMSFRSCRSCAQCHRGEPSYCASFDELNFSGARPDGTSAVRDQHGRQLNAHFLGQSSFATHAVVAASSAVPIDHQLDLAVVGSLGCGFQTGAGAILNVLRPGPSSSVVVFGAGSVGLAAVMAAAAAGCASIVAVDVHPARRRLALDVGATAALDGHDRDGLERLGRLHSAGFDAAVDTTGVASVVETAVASLNRRGTCAVVGVGPDERLGLDWRTLLNGRTVTGVVGGSSLPEVFIPELIELHQRGRFPVDRLISTFPFARINDAVAAVERGDAVKAVLTF